MGKDRRNKPTTPSSSNSKPNPTTENTSAPIQTAPQAPKPTSPFLSLPTDAAGETQPEPAPPAPTEPEDAEVELNSKREEDESNQGQTSRPSTSAGSDDGSTGSNELVVVEPQAEEDDDDEEKAEEAAAPAEEEKQVEQEKAKEEDKEDKTPTTTPEKNIPTTQSTDTTTTSTPAAAESTVTSAAAESTVTSAAAKPLQDSPCKESLNTCLTKANAFISHLNRLLSGASGQDRALMVLSYTLTALTAHLDQVARLRATAHATNPSQKVSIVPIGLSGFIVFARELKSSRLAAVSIRLKALASLISDVRIFMRLWGLLGIYEWGLSVLRSPPKDKTLRNIAYAQVGVNVFYQILENLAYLGQHKVLPVGNKKQTQYWLWSSRFWMMHVILEFWRLKRDRDLNLKGKGKVEEEKVKVASASKAKWYDFRAVLKGQGTEHQWLRQLWSNTAYAPLTVHWSLESGALSPLSVGTLGMIAGVIGLNQAWRNTA